MSIPTQQTNLRILITGAGGFVGSAILKAVCLEFPHIPICTVDISPSAQQQVSNTSPPIEVIVADVRVPETLEKVFSEFRPTVIVHTAGVVPPPAKRHSRGMQAEVYRTNLEGTRNVVNAAVRNRVKAFVYTSSCCAVVDDFSNSYHNIDERWPTSHQSSIYGESKALAEEVVLGANDASFSTCVLRPSVLCGPGDPSLVPSIHACIAKGETPYIIGDGFNLWDVTYVDNVADAHVLAIKNLISSKSAAGEAFFIQNNEPVTFRDLCLAIWAAFGHTPPFELHIPLSLAWIAGLLAEMCACITGSPTTLTRGSVRDACSIRYANGEKARNILGYDTRIGLAEGVKLSCEDYRARLDTGRSQRAQKDRRPNSSAATIE